MGHFVIVEVAGGCEPLAADPTLVRLLPAVNAPVSVEAGRGAESFGTDLALMRPLTRVDPNVTLEQAGPIKGLPTVMTR